MLKKWIVVLLLALFIAALGKGWHWAKDGFSVRRICANLPQDEEPFFFDSQAVAAIDQDFFYLGRGRQCYAFLSRDGKYVLKLPRLDMYREPFWLRVCGCACLDKYRKDWCFRQSSRLRFLMASFDTAFSDLKESSALLAKHLKKTDSLHLSLSLKDRLGRTARMDLDQTAFLLQKREDLMIPFLEKALRDGDKERAEKVLYALLEMVAAHARKGICNKDPTFLSNFGFDGTRGVHIDVGSFYRPEQGGFSTFFMKTVSHVNDWLSAAHPEMAPWFSHQAAQFVIQEEKP